MKKVIFVFLVVSLFASCDSNKTADQTTIEDSTVTSVTTDSTVVSTSDSAK